MEKIYSYFLKKGIHFSFTVDPEIIWLAITIRMIICKACNVYKPQFPHQENVMIMSPII